MWYLYMCNTYLNSGIIKQLLCQAITLKIEVILCHAIFAWYKTITIIINQLLQFYLLICVRILLSIFVIILKASTAIVCAEVWAFTEKFHRTNKTFLQVALYFLQLFLIFDSYFVLFMRLCLSTRECTHLMGQILLGVGSHKIGMPTTSSDWCFFHCESF